MDSDFEEAVRRIRDDRQRGASELAREGLRLMAGFARRASAATTPDLVEQLREGAALLAAARPSMAPLRNLMARWSAALDGLPDNPQRAAHCAAAVAEEFADISRGAVREAAARMAARVAPGATIMTHSLSSTVVELFRLLKHRKVRAIVTESRPLLEGHALSAKLNELAIRTTLVTDAQIGLAVRDADLVVVGADSVLADGSVVNKAGTYLLALAAKEAGVPFHVCCESFKRCPPDMTEPVLECLDPADLGAPELPFLTVVNRGFDLTPARLITACVTETDNSSPPP